MTFFDRDTNFPWKSHGLWWLSQFRRWGMVGADVDYRASSTACTAPTSSRGGEGHGHRRPARRT